MLEKNVQEELMVRVRQLEGELVQYREKHMAARSDRDLLGMLFENAPLCLTVWSPHGQLMKANKGFTQLTGYTTSEICDLEDWFARAYPDAAYRDHVMAEWQSDAKAADAVREFEVTCRNGRSKVIEFRAVFLQDLGAVVSMVDISSLRRTTDALKASEERLRKAVNEAPHPVMLYGDDGKILKINRAWSEILGYRTEEIPTIARWWEKIFRNEKKVADNSTRSTTPHGLEDGEYRVWTKGGDIRWWDFKSAYLGKLPDGRGMTISMATDITERKQMEDDLKFTQFAVDRSSDSAFWMTRDARFFYVNDAACRSLGYSRNELLSMTVHDIDPNFPESTWHEHWAEVKGMGSLILESCLRKKDGDVFPVEVKENYIEFDGKEYNCAYVRDISERKAAEKHLKESEEKFRQMADNINATFWMRDPATSEILYVSPAFETMWQRPLKQLYEDANIWMVSIHPEDKKIVENNQEKHSKGIATNEEYRIILPDETVRWILCKAYPVVDEDGLVYRIVGTAEDITERKANEEEKSKLQAQLLQAQKMEAIGTLAGGMAHDFNNLLMGIQGRTSLMLTAPDIDPSHQEHLKGIESYIKSAADLTRQLLGLARGGKYEVKPTALNELVSKCVEMFGRTKKEVKIHTKLSDALWTVDVDRRQIDQVLLSIFVNAWQAMPAGGDMYVQTENIFLEGSESEIFRQQRGRHVKISITDTGVGMDAATMQKIFDPFFTTKGMGRGTGLGLASAYGIVKNHNGNIHVYSEIGKGTTFNIYLPASSNDAHRERDAVSFFCPGTETILLVDDERLVIDVGKSMLEKLGYTVYVAPNGESALEQYQTCGDMIDMVVLDMIMPGMNGGETYDRLKRVNPEVKVLLSSGYSINGDANEILSRGCNGFIQKPFTLSALSQKVREVLDKR